MNETRSTLAGSRRTGWVAASVSVLFALGSCASLDQVFSAVTGEVPGEAFAAEMQMRVVFPLAFYGYGGDPAHGYGESIGTVWEQTDSESDDVVQYERALLRRNADGTMWWYVASGAHGELSEFEVLVNERFEAIEMVWPDPDTGEIRRHTLREPVRARGEDVEESDAYVVPWHPDEVEDEVDDDYRVHREQVNVTVAAGTFPAEYVRIEERDDPRNVYEVWSSDDVPGRLIRHTITDGDDVWSGELIEVRSGYRTRFGAY